MNENLEMNQPQAKPAKPAKLPKQKVVRCDKTCSYVSDGNDGRRCKNKCDKEPGHFLNCKCKNHELQ